MTDLEKATIEALDHAISLLESVKDTLVELRRVHEGNEDS